MSAPPVLRPRSLFLSGHVVILFFATALSIYPIYVYGIDFGVIGLLILFSIGLVEAKTKYPAAAIYIIISFALIFLVSLLFYTYDSISQYFFLRSARALISAFAIFLAFYNLPRVLIIKVVFYVLLLHFFALYFVFVSNEFKSVVGSAIGVKDITLDYGLRSFGLVSSYDTAGFLVFSLILSYYILCREQVFELNLFILLFFLLAGVMTGRFFMVVFAFFLVAYYLLNFKKIPKKTNVAIFFMLAVCILLAIFNLEAVLGFLGFCSSCELASRAVNDGGYYSGSFDGLIRSTVFGLSLVDNWFIGIEDSENYVGLSDVGYVKILIELGFLGLFFYLLPYLVFLLQIKRRSFPHGAMLAFLCIFLVYNIKIIAFSARGFNEIFLIFFIYLIKYQKDEFRMLKSEVDNA